MEAEDGDELGYVSVLESGTMQQEAEAAAEKMKRKASKQVFVFPSFIFSFFFFPSFFNIFLIFLFFPSYFFFLFFFLCLPLYLSSIIIDVFSLFRFKDK